MLPSRNGKAESMRLATTDDYDRFFMAADLKASAVRAEQALEESFFLGLRLNGGVEMERIQEEFGAAAEKFGVIVDELVTDGLLVRTGQNLRLTSRGRLLSNGVFQRFISDRDPQGIKPKSSKAVYGTAEVVP